MKTVFRLIPKESNKLEQFRNTSDLSVFLTGRRISAYIVIKSDAQGDRVVDLSTANDNVSAIKQILEQA